MAKIALDIVTPERKVLSVEADFIVLPAFAGELGVLPGHAPLLSQLAPGQLRIRQGEEVQFFAVSGGFVEVQDNKVSVFAETAEMPEEINVERARLAKGRAQAAINNKASTPQDLAAAQGALRRALIRLRVSEGLSRMKKKMYS